jgi:hypothetical protein
VFCLVIIAISCFSKGDGRQELLVFSHVCGHWSVVEGYECQQTENCAWRPVNEKLCVFVGAGAGPLCA